MVQALELVQVLELPQLAKKDETTLISGEIKRVAMDII